MKNNKWCTLSSTYKSIDRNKSKKERLENLKKQQEKNYTRNGNKFIGR